MLKLLALLSLASLPALAEVQCRQQFSELIHRRTGVEFAKQCPKRKPAGYISHRVHMRVENAEMVRACEVCWENGRSSPRVNDTDRTIERNETPSRRRFRYVEDLPVRASQQ